VEPPIFVDTVEAARLVGVGRKLFLALAEEFVQDWLRPVYLGPGRKKRKMWARQDVLVLAHIHQKRVTGSPPGPARPPPG
jgi:hypothetical protein